jgi:hypothetical protein
METRFGEDFSRVRVHTDANAGRTATGLGASAYTMGRHIFFSTGKYDPASYGGRRLLAHELTHVVQQARGPRPASAALTVGQSGDRYEREANRVAERVARPARPVGQAWKQQPERRRDAAVVRVRERVRGPDASIARAAAARAPAIQLKGQTQPSTTLWEATKQCVHDMGLASLIGRLAVMVSCLTPLIAGPEAVPLVWACLKLSGIVLTLTTLVPLVTCIAARYFGKQQPAAAAAAATSGRAHTPA